MRSIFKRLGRLFIYWYYWVLDYLYVGFWQVLGFFRRGDPRVFLSPTPTRHATPVLLIPGVYERWNFMKPIAKSIYNAGYEVHVIEGIGYNRGTVEKMAEAVDAYVAKHSLKNCVLVAHSKGGLIGKYLLSFSNKKGQYAGMVSVSTPYNGSVYAHVLPFSSLRIFIPNSPLLLQLAKSADVNARIVSIYGKFDPHIPGGSFLKGAQNIRLATYGHFRIIKDKAVHREILDAIKKLSR